MNEEITYSEAKIFRPGWKQALEIWWWWAWRTFLATLGGSLLWCFFALAVFPEEAQRTMVIGGGYLWGFACSVYFLRNLFTHGRFFKYSPVLMKD